MQPGLVSPFLLIYQKCVTRLGIPSGTTTEGFPSLAGLSFLLPFEGAVNLETLNIASQVDLFSLTLEASTNQQN